MHAITLEKDNSVILHHDAVTYEDDAEFGRVIKLDKDELAGSQELLVICQGNVKEVILSTVHIESLIARSLARYFSVGEKRQFIRELIFESDSFSIASKLKALKGIATKAKLHKDDTWKTFEDAIRRVIRYRNMLAHGMMRQHKTRDGFKIKASYYEGAPQEMILDDVRWKKIEESFGLCISSLNALLISLGIEED